MSVIYQLLIATILIAGMILLRLLMDRRALRTKIRGNTDDGECEHTGCFHGCSKDGEVVPDSDLAAGPNK